MLYFRFNLAYLKWVSYFGNCLRWMERISATEMPDSNAGADVVLREKGKHCYWIHQSAGLNTDSFRMSKSALILQFRGESLHTSALLHCKNKKARTVSGLLVELNS